jgi:hypothetical protein
MTRRPVERAGEIDNGQGVLAEPRQRLPAAEIRGGILGIDVQRGGEVADGRAVPPGQRVQLAAIQRADSFRGWISSAAV